MASEVVDGWAVRWSVVNFHYHFPPVSIFSPKHMTLLDICYWAYQVIREFCLKLVPKPYHVSLIRQHHPHLWFAGFFLYKSSKFHLVGNPVTWHTTKVMGQPLSRPPYSIDHAFSMVRGKEWPRDRYIETLLQGHCVGQCEFWLELRSGTVAVNQQVLELCPLHPKHASNPVHVLQIVQERNWHSHSVFHSHGTKLLSIRQCVLCDRIMEKEQGFFNGIMNLHDLWRCNSVTSVIPLRCNSVTLKKAMKKWYFKNFN